MARFPAGGGLRAQLARGALRGILISVLGILVGFLVQVAVARMLGVAEFGVYTWALACMNFMLLVSCSGLDGLTVRKLPSLLLDRQWGKVRGLFRFSIAWVGGVAFACAVVLYGAAWLLREHALPGALDTLALCIVVTPLFALGSLRQSALGALKHVAKAQVLEAVVRPIILLLVLAAMIYLVGMAPTSALAMIGQLSASVIVFVVGGIWLFQSLPRETRDAMPEREAEGWLRQAFPFLAISGASAFGGQAGMLALGAMGTATDTGIYAAVLRINDIAMMGIYSIGAIASPLFVETLARKDRAGLVHLLTWGARGALLFALLASAGIVLLGDWVLAAFGKRFLEGHDPLYIMLPGVLISAFAGMSGFLLAMSGHAAQRAAVGWLCAISNILVCIVAVPNHGIYGAAWGYVVSSLINAILCLFLCWRYLRVWAGLR